VFVFVSQILSATDVFSLSFGMRPTMDGVRAKNEYFRSSGHLSWDVPPVSGAADLCGLIIPDSPVLACVAGSWIFESLSSPSLISLVSVGSRKDKSQMGPAGSPATLARNEPIGKQPL
jgi:hypothetical protein